MVASVQGGPLWGEAVWQGLLPALADAGLRVDVRTTLLVQTWVQQTAAQGRLPEAPAGAQAVLRALVCKSAAESAVFDRVFGRWVAGNGEASTHSPNSPQDDPEEPASPLPRSGWWRHLGVGRVMRGVYGLLVIGFALYLQGVDWQKDMAQQERLNEWGRNIAVNRTQFEVGEGVVSASGATPANGTTRGAVETEAPASAPAAATASSPERGLPPLTQILFDPPARLWGQLPIVYLGLALLLWSLSYLLHRAQRQEMARLATRQQLREQHWHAGELLRHVGQRRADVRQAARLLRKPHILPSAQLDLPATVQASVRAAGRFTPVHRPRRVSRHLVVLIERSRPGDPLATLSHRLVQALAQEGVLVQLYEFERDIRWLTPWAPERAHRIEGQAMRQQRRLPLSALEPLHVGCGLLVCSDGQGLIDPRSGRLCEWVARSLAAWPDRALLTPALPAQWGESEDELAGAEGSFLVVPALSAALPVVAQWFQGQWCELPPLAEAPRRPPSLLHGQPLRWLMSEAPPEAEQDELLRQLRAYLGPQAFQWLAAAAVYPQVSLALTEFLVQHLSPPSEAEAATQRDEHARRHEVWWLALMALPWFRHGQMPDWLRLGLLRSLPAATLAALREALHALLNAPTSAAALDMGTLATPALPLSGWARAWAQWRRRVREQHVLEGEPRHSPLRDVIYVGVLTGQVDALLRLAVGEGLARQLQPEGARWSLNPLRWVAAGMGLGVFLREGWQQAWRRARRVVRPWPGDGLPWARGWQGLAAVGVGSVAVVGGVLPYGVPGAFTPPAVTWPLPGAAQTPAMPAGTRFRDCSDGTCPWLVVVPAGRFLMGSPETEEGRYTDEGPQHWVTLKKQFAVMQTEVTVGMFQKFVEETRYEATKEGCNFWNGKKWEVNLKANWEVPFVDVPQTPQQPVVCVNWHDAQAFAQWMSRRTGQLYRLLSESEWEYVARAGTKTAYEWGEDNDHTQQCQHANGADQTAKNQFSLDNDRELANCEDGYAYTAPVASFKANQFGLYDTSGNAWEWVQDCREDYSAAETIGEAVETKKNCNRVLRGGGRSNNPQGVRPAIRYGLPPTGRNNDMGFRLARMLP